MELIINPERKISLSIGDMDEKRKEDMELHVRKKGRKPKEQTAETKRRDLSDKDW